MTRKHAMETIVLDEDGIPRFKQNRIVRFLLFQYKPGSRISLSDLPTTGMTRRTTPISCNRSV